MHGDVHNFVKKHSGKLTGKVFEVGSYNVNGGVRDIIPDLLGIDLRKGPGVDLVCPVEDLHKHYGNESFDACVSTDTLEHVQDWKGLTYEDYQHRCQEDVKINKLLWDKLKRKLNALYG
jgi:hypothetical protein